MSQELIHMDLDLAATIYGGLSGHPVENKEVIEYRTLVAGEEGKAANCFFHLPLENLPLGQFITNNKGSHGSCLLVPGVSTYQTDRTCDEV
jgi:hypothetical protein